MTMKVSDHPARVADRVITEAHAIKRGFSERHGNDIDRLLASLLSQERASRMTKAKQAEPAQPLPASKFR